MDAFEQVHRSVTHTAFRSFTIVVSAIVVIFVRPPLLVRSCRRSRRGSDDWGTRDWGRGLRSSAAVARARTESTPESQLGDYLEGGPALVRVLPRGSPPSLEEGDDHELRFVEEDVESLSTMSATTSEHEFFARTMLYC